MSVRLSYLLLLLSLLVISSLVLLLNYFHEGGDIGVRHLGDGDIDETKGVMGLQGVLVNQFKLHQDYIVLHV